MMRWLFRLTILALAAFGAKTLYDRWYGDAASRSVSPLPDPTPYVEAVRTEVEEVVAAPYDPEIGIAART